MPQVRHERTALVMVAVLATMAACRPTGGEAEPLSESDYISVMARLSLIEVAISQPEQGAAADSARARVLSDYGVDPDHLIAFAAAAGNDPERMQALWQAITDTVEQLRAAGWSGRERADESTARPDTAAPDAAATETGAPDRAAPDATPPAAAVTPTPAFDDTAAGDDAAVRRAPGGLRPPPKPNVGESVRPTADSLRP